jgi:hypothetical protein
VGEEAKNMRAAHDFVQQFYDWYIQAAAPEHTHEPGMNTAVRLRASSLDSTLLRLLKTDIAHQHDEPGSITGIDWDPFLNTQDPCKRYNAGSVSVRSDHYRVNVTGDCSAEFPQSFIAVVRKNGKKWILENVEDGKGYSTVASLQANQAHLKK